MSGRNNQKQIWADAEFVKKLELIKAKRLLVGKPINNMGDLTKMICETDSFRRLEEEILNFDPLNPRKKKKNNLNLKIKFDGGLFG